MIRVVLPAHLRNLANISGEVHLDLPPPVTPRRIVDELEKRYPALLGTIRDAHTQQRRPYVRFFACREDVSFADPDLPVAPPVAAGEEPFIILGAIAGG
uniref:MoaD/ThiS family protein n=1 Tax=Bellilinea caldifistulae TaxID=360411 RepID=A0A7C4L013_9CHLR